MTDLTASIIIPTHGRDVLVAKAASSALAQSIPDIEVIVIDDGNTDQTQDVLSLLEEMDERLIVLTLPPPGLGISGGLQRNEAVKVARGKYICYLDDDDVYTYRAVQSRVDFLEANPEYDFCWGASMFLRNHGSDEWKHLCRKRLVAEPRFGQDIPWQHGTIIPNELMHRAGVVGESGIWWTHGRGEDQRLVQAFLDHGFQGAPVDFPVAIYGRHHPFEAGRVGKNKVIQARAEAAQAERMRKAGADPARWPIPAPTRLPEDPRERIQARSNQAALRRSSLREKTQVAVPQVQDHDEAGQGRRTSEEGV